MACGAAERDDGTKTHGATLSIDSMYATVRSP
ncbi:hypothetical protein SNOG_10838 [Parastagonospora nodorum SN15]|uniref:Uncharacterized protein n=1 Tax=Phaeosphaeria nodorum (strain SN15 / ATCC MYA-4574 / FGSC 10173) TaxID=321614 RepID=Q0UBM6_PHANO|nr:hypothetical protein SNOG_10838 [Parastagonospora nodorum SN15]EAT82232.1 hypothetical protein SNOG_10838 [Parastagonospora nodorum SN15]